MQYGGRWFWGVARGFALLIGLAVGASVEANPNVGAHAEFGVGEIRTRPFVVGGGVAATIAAGLSTRFVGPVTGCAEFQATTGRNFPLKGNLEAADAGHQSLTTLVGALELHGLPRARGAVCLAGLGVGRSTISGARGAINSPDFGQVQLRDRTALAYALGLGYRFGGGAWGTQLALRAHGLFRNGLDSSAYATALMIGVAY